VKITKKYLHKIIYEEVLNVLREQSVETLKYGSRITIRSDGIIVDGCGRPAMCGPTSSIQRREAEKFGSENEMGWHGPGQYQTPVHQPSHTDLQDQHTTVNMVYKYGGWGRAGENEPTPCTTEDSPGVVTRAIPFEEMTPEMFKSFLETRGWKGDRSGVTFSAKDAAALKATYIRWMFRIRERAPETLSDFRSVNRERSKWEMALPRNTREAFSILVRWQEKDGKF